MTLYCRQYNSIVYGLYALLGFGMIRKRFHTKHGQADSRLLVTYGNGFNASQRARHGGLLYTVPHQPHVKSH